MPKRYTMQRHARLLICLAAALCCAGGAGASDGGRLQGPAGVGIGRLQVLEDASAKATLGEIEVERDRFRDVQQRTPNYNFSASAYWFRLPVENHRDQPVELFLNIRHPLLDHVTLYVTVRGADTTVIESGHRIPVPERAYPATTLVLPFRLAAGAAAELFVRIRSDTGAILVPIAVLDRPALRALELTGRTLHGALLGLFVGLFIYNLLLYVQLRERSYLYYVAYLPFAFLSVTALDGFGPAVLYPWSTGLDNVGLSVFSGAAYLLILAFTRAFLRTPEHPRLDRWIKLLMVVGAVLILSPLLFPIRVAIQLLMLMLFAFPLVSSIVGIKLWRRGRREARFFVLGQAASWVGLIVFGLQIYDVIPYHVVLGESISIGIAGDAMLLALALADRIRLLQEAKLAAENAARRNLEVRRDELEHMVSARTAELDEARRKAERLATTDPLTGIANRRGLFEAAEREVKLAARSRRPLAVVMFDLDHFKRVNDSYGHGEGDRVLRDVVGAARSLIRDTDLLGRIGGEEFLLVLPDTSKPAALLVAERIRARVAEKVSVGTPPQAVTASFGVAALTTPTQDIDALESAADAALYRAKNNGRNRVEAAD